MELPKKNTKIPLDDVKEICMVYGLFDDYQVLCDDPPKRPFKTDYVSCFPDIVEECGEEVDLRWPAVLHDIGYHCGYRGDREARLIRDSQLQINVIKMSGGSAELAEKMYIAVRAMGNLPGTGFHWAYGRDD